MRRLAVILCFSISSLAGWSQPTGGTAYVLTNEEGEFNYDAIGNLIWDQDKGVRISWTPYGKVREVTKGDGTVVSFRYEGAGNRIEKKMVKAGNTTITRYVRDAGGNVMAVYNDAVLLEQSIYGSTRLGLYHDGAVDAQRTLGFKTYELTNHLGNVLSVVTDNIRMTPDSTWATVVSAGDYYSFGSGMPGRDFADGIYRYGFNGKERDSKGEWGNITYDYGFRIYNPSIGRFLSGDPLTNSYPWYTPYQFAGNRPIESIDIDGLEEVSNKVLNDVRFIELKKVTFKMVVRESTETLTAAMSKTVDPKLDNYSINTQMGEPAEGKNPAYYTARSPQPDYTSQGLNVVNGEIVKGRSAPKTWYFSINNNIVTAGMGDAPEESDFAIGGATPLYVNGLKYGVTNIWKDDTPKEIDRIMKGQVAPEHQPWLLQKSNGVYLGQNGASEGKTVLAYNSANQHWLIASQENVIFGGMTYDQIRDQLITQGFDLILGFDRSNSAILLKNGSGSDTSPASYKNNTMPTGVTLSVPKIALKNC